MGRWKEKITSHPNANLLCKSPLKTQTYVGAVSTEIQTTWDFLSRHICILLREDSVLCPVNSALNLCSMPLPLYIHYFYIYKKKDRNGKKKNNQNNNLRNTIKKTVATAAPEEKHSKRGSLEAKDQLRRQKCSALRLWAAKFPTLSLSLGICTIKKAYKLIKPYFMLLLENTWGKLLFCNVCPGKRKRQTSFYMCILFYSIAEMTKIVQGEGGWCSPWVPIDSSGAGGYTFIYASWETRPGVLIIQTTLNPDLLFPRNKGSEMEGQTA